VVLTEADLASRWGMSPKTLQRWRTEGRGPHYLKLGKRVSYPLKAVIAFENFVRHVSTSQKAPRSGDAP
jgi:predicted site-specific integrase-resolvase